MQPVNSSNAAGGERQILTFTLGSPAGPSQAGVSEHATGYGIDLADVQEIRGYTPATPIPNTPAYIKGAINLRGAVIPVIDLRLRFGVPRLEYTKFTVIIVVNVSGKTVGLVADGVSDVLSLKSTEVLPPPDFGPGSDGDCVDGIASIEGNLVMLLHLRRMLAPDGIVDPDAGAAPAESTTDSAEV
jgi:purine-binding chemotaxis protein CheW